jgi:hypothetical protein
MGSVDYKALDGIEYINWVAGEPDTGLDSTAMQQYLAFWPTITKLFSPDLARMVDMARQAW